MDAYMRDDMVFYVRTWTPHTYEHRIDGPFVHPEILVRQIRHSLRDGCESARERIQTRFFDYNAAVSGRRYHDPRSPKSSSEDPSHSGAQSRHGLGVPCKGRGLPSLIAQMIPPAMSIPAGHFVAEKMRPWSTHVSEEQAVDAAWLRAKELAEKDGGYVLEGDQYAARPFRLTVTKSDPRGVPVTTV
ncbi:hypothetical protein LTR10_012357 [Elasticomyces elasticus]|nr:hypothetical protein LTR10_012357 [Elasticomyces elasticus]KAK4965832.1 hypothetical protein LTR42_011846 [Elasticomyces elasticus]